MGINFGSFISAVKKGANKVIDNNTPVGIYKAAKGLKKDRAAAKKSQAELEKIRQRRRQQKLRKGTEEAQALRRKRRKKNPGNTPSVGQPGYNNERWR